MDDLAPARGDHLVHSICDDVARAREDSFGVRASTDESRDAARLMDCDLLIVLEGVLVAANLRDHGVAQSQSLVAMLLHIFDIDVVSLGDVD